MHDDGGRRGGTAFREALAFELEECERVAALVAGRPLRVRTPLQQRRYSNGLSQDELAAVVGVSRQTISSIENRRTTPSVRLALVIAATLRTSVEELFGDEPP